MKIVSITDARKNFAAVLEQVIEDQEPVAIPRPGGDAVVIVDKSEWDSMRETLYVLGTRANARRLLDSMDHIDKGEVVTTSLEELEAQAAKKPTRSAVA